MYNAFQIFVETACHSFNIASIQFRVYASQRSQNLARELAAFDTRLPDAVVASFAGGATLKDMPAGTVGVDRSVATELPSNFVAETLGGVARLFI